jgi:hypothetical protein
MATRSFSKRSGKTGKSQKGAAAGFPEQSLEKVNE